MMNRDTPGGGQPQQRGEDAPLSDIRVLDLTGALAGPFATLILAGLGAEVLKVEMPGGGDIARSNPPYLGRDGLHFDSPKADDISLSILNRSRNKKSLTIDLKQDAGRRLFLELAAQSDVVVQNLSDGAVDRLGVGYEAVHEVNPKAIYCSLSGLGQDSPMPGLKSMDILIQSLSGIMEVTGFPEGPPVRVGVPIGDMIGPLYAVSGILAALWERQKTGRGQHVDVSLLDSLVSLVSVEHFDVLEGSGFPSRSGNLHSRLAPFGAFQAKDGYVAIAAPTDEWARELFGAMGHSHLAEDPRFSHRGSRARNADALHALIGAWVASLTTDEVVDELFEKRRVPTVRVRRPEEVMADPALRAREALVPLHHPTLDAHAPLVGTGLPIRFTESRVGYHRPAPVLGADSADVLSELLGLSVTELEQLAADGVI